MIHDPPGASVAELTGKVRQLERLVASLLAQVPPVRADEPRRAAPADAAIAARTILEARRHRALFFDAGFFGEAAWDVLLELHDAATSGRATSVSALCVRSAVPPTTALRWIETLERAGLIARAADPHHGRRVLVTLTADARDRLDRYFGEVAPS